MRRRKLVLAIGRCAVNTFVGAVGIHEQRFSTSISNGGWSLGEPSSVVASNRPLWICDHFSKTRLHMKQRPNPPDAWVASSAARHWSWSGRTATDHSGRLFILDQSSVLGHQKRSDREISKSANCDRYVPRNFLYNGEAIVTSLWMPVVLGNRSHLCRTH